MQSKKIVKSLKKGLLILKKFSIEKPGLLLTEIAIAANMSPSTCYRYIHTLKELGYVKQDIETKKYWLTPKVLELGFAVFRSMDLRERVRPYMLEVSNDLNVTAECSLLDGTGVVLIERVRSKGIVNLDLFAGSRLPVYCTSMGKALLAFMDEKTRRELVDKLELVPQTAHTITDKDVLWKELERIREIGYSTNNQELREGLFGVAAPIFKEGQVEAALGFSLSINVIADGDTKERVVKRLLDITKKISIG